MTCLQLSLVFVRLNLCLNDLVRHKLMQNLLNWPRSRVTIYYFSDIVLPKCSILIFFHLFFMYCQKQNFIMQDKISFVLWATRMFTIVCTLFFIFPFTGYDPNALYQKALMASAATSALKLHQRMASIRFQLSKEYLGRLIIEDSFHYLLFALIFLNVFPVTSRGLFVVAFCIVYMNLKYRFTDFHIKFFQLFSCLWPHLPLCMCVATLKPC